MDVVDLQRLIDGLECFKTKNHPCRGCWFNPHPGMDWPYGCIRGQYDIVEAAQAALRSYLEATDHGEETDGG